MKKNLEKKKLYLKNFSRKALAVFLSVSFVFGLSGCGLRRQPDSRSEREGAVPEEIPLEDNYRTWYEVFVYSFYDGNGDGIGDLSGLTEKLDYINDGDGATDGDLGCSGIWLMPIMPSPTYHKYDVTDYCDIDAEYGTMEDFEIFMEACRKRGIKVILDLAINHTSSQHPWFREACGYLADLGEGEPSYEECPYVDYYHFSKEKASGYCPVPGSDSWYYEAQFWEGMPDLNLSSRAVRKEIEEIVGFWLSKGVGGFRLDAAKEYVSGDKDANIEILTWFVDMVKEKKEDAYLVAEVWTDRNTYAEYYKSGIDSIFNFAFADSDGIIANVVKGSAPATLYGNALEESESLFESYNPAYIDAPFYTNHDLGRSAGYYAGDYSEAQTKIAGALNLLMSGSAFVYYGEELGMKGAGKDENKRAPMYFSSDPAAEGMCKGPADREEVRMKYGSYEEQAGDASSIYNYYKRAIYLRNLFPALRKGKQEALSEYATETLAAVSKTWEGETFCIFCNLSPEKQTLSMAGEDGMELEAGLYTGEEEASWENGTLTLPSYGIAIMSR